MSPSSESESGAVAGEPSVEPSSAASAIDDPNAVYALGSSSGESGSSEGTGHAAGIT